MPDWLLALFAGLGLASGIARIVAGVRRLRLGGGGVRPVDIVLTAVGAAGLILHCTAMFRPRSLTLMGALRPLVRTIDDLGPASIALYVAPAVLVLVGLRRIGPIWFAVLALALIAVGITMYDGGPLRVHLVAITAAVLVLAAAVALRTPRRPPPRRPAARDMQPSTAA